MASHESRCVHARGLSLAVLLVCGLRLLSAAAIPLSGDEAYYWEWTRHLSLGYHDHPPLVAWIISLATHLLGTSTFTVRLPFVLMGAALPWLVYLMARRLGCDERAAVSAGLLILVTPLFTLAGMAAFPDVPLLFASACFLLCAWRAMQERGIAWWLCAGVAAGAAALSKLTGLYLMPCLLLFLLSSPSHRLWLGRPQLYLAAVVALLVWSPFLYWNAAHGWESFAYQYGSRLGAAGGVGAKHLTEYLALSAVALSPLFFLMLWWVLLRVAALGRDSHLWYVFCMGFPLQIFFLLCSLRVKIGLHWAAPAVLISFVALGWWMARGTPSPTRKLACSVAVGMALLISGMVYLVALSPATLLGAVSSLRLSGVNRGQPLTSELLAEVLGYPAAAEHVRQVANAMRSAASNPFLFTTGYSLSSVLSFYSGESLHVVMGTDIGAEYDRWDDFPGMLGRDGLYIDSMPIPRRQDVMEHLNQAFERVTLDPPFQTTSRGVGSRSYYLARCWRFRRDVFTRNHPLALLQ